MKPEMRILPMHDEIFAVRHIEGPRRDDRSGICNKVAFPVDEEQRSHEGSRGRTVEQHAVLKIGWEALKIRMPQSRHRPLQRRVEQLDLAVEIARDGGQHVAGGFFRLLPKVLAVHPERMG